MKIKLKTLQSPVVKGEKQGFKRIIIGTGDASTKSWQFYQKQGFEIFGVKEGFFLIIILPPIYEEGIPLKDMVMLKRELQWTKISRIIIHKVNTRVQTRIRKLQVSCFYIVDR